MTTTAPQTTLVLHHKPLQYIPDVIMDAKTIRNFAIAITQTEAHIPACDLLSFYVFQTVRLDGEADFIFSPAVIDKLHIDLEGKMERYSSDETIALPLDRSIHIGAYTHDNTPLICLKLIGSPKTFIFYSKTTVAAALQYIRQEYINLGMSAPDIDAIQYENKTALPSGNTPLLHAFFAGKLNLLYVVG